jgi:opacity protein-like surface antigen
MNLPKQWAVLAVFLGAISSYADAQIAFGGGGAQFGIAFSSFTKPAGDLYGTGLVFGGHGDININKYIAVRLSFDYPTFGADGEKLKGVASDASVNAVQDFLGRGLSAQEVAEVKGTIKSADGGRVSAPAIFVTGLGKLPTGSMVTPYGLLGFGITFLSFGDINYESSGVSARDPQTGQLTQVIPAGSQSVKIDSQTKFGIQFGAGSEFKLSKLVRLYFEAKYSLIFTDGGSSSYFPLVVGATFGG